MQSQRKKLMKKTKKKQLSRHQRWHSHIRSKFGVMNTSDGYGTRMLIPYPLNGDQIPRIPPQTGNLCVVQPVNSFQGGTGFTTNSAGAITMTQNSNATVVVSTSFQLADIAQNSTFSALFDQYRLEEVHLRIRPRSTFISLAGIASPNQESPRIYCVVDRDDASTLSNISSALEYDNVVEVFGGQALDVILEPSATGALYSTGAFSGYEIRHGGKKAPWIDLANPNVPHYGVKLAITPLQATSTYAWLWDVEAWYKLSFRSVR